MTASPTSLHDELRWRGLLHQETEGCEAFLAKAPVTGYCGFDPTAESLHVGNLVSLMGLVRLARAGHRAVALVGGGTAMIGDPSGKSEERPMRSAEEIAANAELIWQQIQRVAQNALGADALSRFAVRNNAEWLGGIALIEFLRDTGKHFTVNYMLAKESVKRRIASEDGISYTEFTYMMLQAYDFLVLHDRFGCTLQMGGSDQWGNILAGADLIRRVNGGKAHGLVFPLVTNAAGTKFGKTESGTVWLDPARTSPFRFYQFWLNTDDRDVVPYLKYFTWLGRPEIEALETAVAERPERREAQKVLAQEVTRLVHGPAELARAERASEVLFGGSLDGVSVDDLLGVFEDVPSTDVERVRLEDGGLLLPDLLVETGIATSKGEARRLVRAGGVNVNNRRASDENAPITPGDCIEGRLIVLRKGQKHYHLVQVR